MKKILLLEPICRGSRTQILANTVQSLLEEGNKVVLLLRKDYETTHFNELLGSNLKGVEVIKSNIDLKGDWIRNLKISEMLNYMNLIRRNRDKFDEIVFMALDDYLLSFNILLPIIKYYLRNKKINVIKYRVQYLLTANSFRQKALRFLTNFPIKLLHAKLISFDERLDDIKEIKTSVLPDPWFGNFKKPSIEEKSILRDKYKIDKNKNVILIIGRQTERKGIAFIINNVSTILEDKENLVLVVGQIDDEYLDSFNKLKGKFPDGIFHIDYFIPEAQLPEVFQISDTVLLPYSLSFDSSSGVLVRACATGIPVVATSHGLVGYRVENNNLGETFEYQNPQTFLSAFNKAKSSKSSYSTFLKKFSTETSIKSFKSKLKFILKV